jgi:hypothetical protein
MDNQNFVAFILSHGRPDRVFTYNSLKKAGYNGKIYIVIDNEDKTANEYFKNFGKENVIVFDKLEISKTFDEFDTFNDRRAIIYARNATFEIAEKLGYEYFIQLDDDYTDFRYTFDDKGNYLTKNQKIQSNDRLDNLFNSLLNFYKKIPAKAICIAQGGDFIGGEGSSVFKKKLARKSMNSFICSTKRPFQFIGRINEDVNTYTTLGSRGELFFTVSNLRLEQLMTQSNNGGMSDLYLNAGTYVKSFYTIITMPSCTVIRPMGVSNKRLHHQINWSKCVPVILSEKLKK